MVRIAGIFKAYDIRGIAGTELDEQLAYSIGRAFVRVIGGSGKTLLVGRDMRVTSQAYARAFIDGATDEGADIVDAGLVSTTLFYFAAKGFVGGCMVTASHNPKEYNGFKFCGENVQPINYANGIDRIEATVTAGLPTRASARKGNVTARSFLDEYLAFNLSFLRISKPVTIVVDAANGMGGHTYGALRGLAKERGLSIIPQFFELDGSFPNHEANPLKEDAVAAMRRALAQHPEASLGVSLDGDADRCVFFAKDGAPVSTDITFALLAKELLKTHPGAMLLYDLRTRRSVKDAIVRAGGRPLMTPCGYAAIRPLMKEKNGLLACELSGHLFAGESSNTENTMYMLFTLLNLLEQEGKTLAELAAPFQTDGFSGEINSKVTDANAALARVDAKFSSLPGADVSRIDGVRVEFPAWWFSVRKSNTEPAVRLVVEAQTRAEMERRRDELLAIIRRE